MKEQAYSMSHSGGLCSYGLLLMVIAYLQYRPANTAATALVGFLNFYGRRFDPQLYGVSVARAAFLPRKSPMSWPPEQAELVERGLTARSKDAGEEAHRFDPLLVEDPVNPTNNVGRNCFRIRQIQRSLARAADMLESNEAGTLRAILRADGPPEENVDAPSREIGQCRFCLESGALAEFAENGSLNLDGFLLPSSKVPRRSSGDDSNNIGGTVIAIILVVILFLAIIGIFFLMLALVTWIQKVASRYVALQELRELTTEYVVQDLSNLMPKAVQENSHGFDVESGSAPPLDWVPRMPQEVRVNLGPDLQAVYGLQSL
ncbi:unnamed protein product [Effrenium voratum]|nr:unnamed protein product [Effrenium voratum]